MNTFFQTSVPPAYAGLMTRARTAGSSIAMADGYIAAIVATNGLPLRPAILPRSRLPAWLASIHGWHSTAVEPLTGFAQVGWRRREQRVSSGKAGETQVGTRTRRRRNYINNLLICCAAKSPEMLPDPHLSQ